MTVYFTAPHLAHPYLRTARIHTEKPSMIFHSCSLHFAIAVILPIPSSVFRYEPVFRKLSSSASIYARPNKRKCLISHKLSFPRPERVLHTPWPVHCLPVRRWSEKRERKARHYVSLAISKPKHSILRSGRSIADFAGLQFAVFCLVELSI